MPEEQKRALAYIGLFIFLISQTVGAVWWAGGMSARQQIMIQRLQRLEERIQSDMDDRYRSADAKRDFERRDFLIEDINEKTKELHLELVDVRKEMALMKANCPGTREKGGSR